MIPCLVVTHGQLASELLAAAEMIVGEIRHIQALCLGWQDDAAEAREAIGHALHRLDQGQGVLIMTDMFGGTPTNLAMSFLTPGGVEVVTGVNLPMMVKAASPGEGETLAELARTIRDKGCGSITVASQLLGPVSPSA